MLRIIAALLAVVAAACAAGQSAPCASRLFVSGYFTTVHVYDACTGAYLRDLDSNTRIAGAQAVKLGPDGLLYVTSEITQRILRYRNDTLEFVDVFVTLPGADPTGFAFGADGSVFVAAFKSNDVRHLSPSGTPLATAVPSGTPGLSGPDNGITFAADGNLYIPSYYGASIVRHDPRTATTTVAIPRATKGLVSPRGILPSRDGTGLLITGEGSGQLLRYDFAGGVVTVLNSALFSPTGIDYGVDGSLLVLETDTVRKLDPATGVVKGTLLADAARIQAGVYLAVIPFASPAPAPVPVVEYYNGVLDHYFISALAADIAALDAGTLAGWKRTGQGFQAYLLPKAGANPVCRFYLPPTSGDSHFYSASPQECADVAARFPSFVLEAPDVMYVALPDPATGACPAGLAKVYRLWNGRVDSNHRYTTDPAVKAAMSARGYVAEGYGPDATIMCAAA